MMQQKAGALCQGNDVAPAESNRLEVLEQELSRERERCSQLQDRCNRQKASLKVAQQDIEMLSARLAHFVDMNKELQVWTGLVEFLLWAVKSDRLDAAVILMPDVLHMMRSGRTSASKRFSSMPHDKASQSAQQEASMRCVTNF